MFRGKRSGLRATVVVSGLAVMASLAGCSSGGGGPSDTGGSSDKVTITFAHWDPNQLELAFPPAIVAFEQEYPNITVDAQQIPYDDFLAKIQTGVVAGTAPDVFVTLPNTIKHFESNNTLLDLSSYLKDDNFDLTNYVPFSVESYQQEGATYGIPWIVDTVGTYYNKDELAKAGFDSMPTGLTWAPDGSGTLLPFLEKLTIDANGVNAGQPNFDSAHVVQYGMGVSPDSTQSFADVLMVGNGGGYQMTPGGEPTVNSAENVEVYQFISDLMYKYHVAPPGSTVIAPNAGAEQGQFLSGEVATLAGGDWLISAIQPGATFKWGVGENPTGPKGRFTSISSAAFSIPQNTAHPAEAVLLAEFLASAKAQTIMAGSGTIQSSLTSLGSIFASAWESEGLDVSALVPENGGTLFGLPSGPNIDAVQIATDAEVAAIYLNTSSVQEALDAAQTAAMSAYKGNG